MADQQELGGKTLETIDPPPTHRPSAEMTQIGAQIKGLDELIRKTLRAPFPIPASEQIEKLAAALAKAQGSFANPEKNKEVEVQPKKRDDGSWPPKYKFSYATLDAVMDVIRKPLADNGLSLVQAPVRVQDGLVVRTILMHESGQWLSSDLPALMKGNSAQDQGSALTYARRYGVISVLGIAADEDEDGNQASGNDVIGKQDKPPGNGTAATPAKPAEPRPVSKQAPPPKDGPAFPPKAFSVEKYQDAADFASQVDTMIAKATSGNELDAIERDNSTKMKKLAGLDEALQTSLAARFVEQRALLASGI